MVTSEQKAFSVTIHFPSGDPDGLAVVDNITRTSQGFSFPRSIFPGRVGEDTLRYPGVYLLWSDAEPGGLPSVYVGKSGNLRERLITHHNTKDKVFWHHTFAFTTNNGALNSAHAGHIEGRLFSLASDAKRCNLENNRTPQVDELVGSDRQDAEWFLEDMLLYMRVMGVRFFEKATVLHLSSQDLVADGVSPDLLHLRGKKMEARGYQDGNRFVVLEGAQAVVDEVNSLSPTYSALRKQLQDAGILVRVSGGEGEFYELKQDYRFESWSAATCVLLGNSSSLSLVWEQKQ